MLSQHILRVNYWKLGEHDKLEPVWSVQHINVDSDDVDLDDRGFQDCFLFCNINEDSVCMCIYNDMVAIFAFYAGYLLYTT